MPAPLPVSRVTSCRCFPFALAPLLGGGEDGGYWLHVTGAAADDAGEGFADVGIGRGRVGVEQFFRGEDQAGGAEAALRSTLIKERLLQRMERTVFCGQALDGADRLVLAMLGEHDAGVDRAPVQQYGADAAVAVRAADFHARVAFAPQDIEQRVRGLTREILWIVIDGDV